jgi:aryl-alcohol dehydrogenase-like predicted oxidoreductase
VTQLINIAGSKVAITRIGFGCARVYGYSELKTSARVIEAALAAGIRHFDTAPSYGEGESESVLGKLVAGLPDVTISSKIGIPRPHASVPRRPIRVIYRRMLRPILSHFPDFKSKLLQIASRQEKPVADEILRRRLSYDEVLQGLEDSFKRLKRSFLDLYLLHEPDQFVLTDELSALFHKLQRDRVIGAFGLAFGRVANASPEFGTVVQSRYNESLPARSIGGHTRIFHGVLRHGWREVRGQKEYAGPTQYIEKVLATHCDAAVIFSASSPGQVRRLVGNLLSNS